MNTEAGIDAGHFLASDTPVCIRKLRGASHQMCISIAMAAPSWLHSMHDGTTNALLLLQAVRLCYTHICADCWEVVLHTISTINLSKTACYCLFLQLLVHAMSIAS